MIKISGNRRVFRGRKMGTVPKTQVSKLRQAQKKSNILKKVKDGPIESTVLRSGLKGVRLMRLSDVVKGHRGAIIAKAEAVETKNWFMRFLDRARETLYDPKNEIMVDIMLRFNYTYLSTLRVEEDYDDKYTQLPTQ